MFISLTKNNSDSLKEKEQNGKLQKANGKIEKQEWGT